MDCLRDRCRVDTHWALSSREQNLSLCANKILYVHAIKMNSIL